MKKNLINTKLFIAGGSGLLGTTLTIAAIKKGYNVTSSYFSKIQNSNVKVKKKTRLRRANS